jgi:hypothetical protein
MPRQLHVSPLGDAWWAKVFEPADGYEEEDPRAWSIELALDPGDPDTIAFIEKIEALYDELHGAGAKQAKNCWPFADQKDRDNNPTGLMRFRFKRTETSAKGNLMSPPVIVDAKKNPWPADCLIGNGSKVKVAFTHWGWTEKRSGAKGISLTLESLQVLDLVPYERVDASSAFGEEEGYVAETPAAQTPFAAEPEAAPMSMAEKLRARAAQVRAEAPGVLAGADAEDIPF